MTTKYLSIGLAALIGICIASCDDNATNIAGDPGGNNGSDKNPTALGGCEIFDGIDHCGIGAAMLTLEGGGLKVDQFGPGGSDGVTSDLVGGASQWLQTATVDMGDPGTFNLKIAALDGGTEAMSLSFTPVGSDLRIVPRFGDEGTRYSVRGYREGELVWEQDNISDLDDAPVFKGIWEADGCWYPVISAKSVYEVMYELKWFSPCPFVTIGINGGDQEEIDELDIIANEDFTLDDFDAVEVTGSLKSFTITSESYSN